MDSFFSIIISSIVPLGEAHGDRMLERFATQRRDTGPSPHVTVWRAAELRRAADVGGPGEGSGHHAGEGGLVQVGLQPGAVGL